MVTGLTGQTVPKALLAKIPTTILGIKSNLDVIHRLEMVLTFMWLFSPKYMNGQADHASCG